MDDLIADFHIHSKYSHDSLMSPAGIVKTARKAGLTCIAITDHDTIRGSAEAGKVGKKYGISVITAAEIKTDCGDIIGLYLNEEIRDRQWHEVICAIRDQGGIAVLPHPYRDHCDIVSLAREVDFIETWNSRCSPVENARSLELATGTGKKRIIGSDAHSSDEIGLAKSRVDGRTLELKEVLRSDVCPSWGIEKSQIISHIKRGELITLMVRGGGYLWRKIT